MDGDSMTFATDETRLLIGVFPFVASDVGTVYGSARAWWGSLDQLHGGVSGGDVDAISIQPLSNVNVRAFPAGF